MRCRFAIALTGVLAFGASPSVSEDLLSIRAVPENAPFSDKLLPGAGMAVEIATSTIAQSPAPVAVQLDWSSTTTSEGVFLPIVEPVCLEKATAEDICARRYFSDPLVELVVLLFVPASEAPRLDAVDGYMGLSFCYAVARDPDTALEIQPRWLSQIGATALGAPDLETCFRMLDAGDVDAVAADEYRGILELFRLELTDRVLPLTDPAGTMSLHMSVSRTHWRATAHIYRVNSGLAALRRSGAYAEIVSRHTAEFWARLKK